MPMATIDENQPAFSLVSALVRPRTIFSAHRLLLGLGILMGAARCNQSPEVTLPGSEIPANRPGFRSQAQLLQQQAPRYCKALVGSWDGSHANAHWAFDRTSNHNDLVRSPLTNLVPAKEGYGFSMSGLGPVGTVAPSASLQLPQGFTVSSWIKEDERTRPASLNQAPTLVTQGSVLVDDPISRPWEELPLEQLLPELGRRGAALGVSVVHGDYLYYPLRGRSQILRRKIQAPWTESQSWEIQDIHQLSATSDTGFTTALSLGRYIYFVGAPGGRCFARYDTTRPFGEASAWILSIMPGPAEGFDLGAWDGRFITLGSGSHLQLIHYDTTRTPTDPQAWQSLDPGLILNRPFNGHGYAGIAWIDRRLFLLTNDETATLIIHTPAGATLGHSSNPGDWQDPQNWKGIGLNELMHNRLQGVIYGAMTPLHQSLYLIPQAGTPTSLPLLRIQLGALDPTLRLLHVDSINLHSLPGAIGISSWNGASTDGRALYLSSANGTILRLDPENSLTDPRSWRIVRTTGASNAQIGGFDGRYLYGTDPSSLHLTRTDVMGGQARWTWQAPGTLGDGRSLSFQKLRLTLQLDDEPWTLEAPSASLGDPHWHHWAATFGASQAILYRDGAQVSQVDHPAAHPSLNASGAATELCFGSIGHRSGFYRGIVNQFQIYDRVLGPLEVSALFRAPQQSCFEVN